MRNPIDSFVLWKLRRTLRKNGYTDISIQAVITMYTRPKPYSNV